MSCPKDQTVLSVSSDISQGMILRGKYEIEAKIGSGGMAAVYRARHLAFGEVRAIKVVSTKLLDDEEFLKRFKAEAVITRKLQHVNAVRVDDLDVTEDGRPFIVMEYVEGRNLRKVISEEGPLAIPRAIDIAKQVASALGAAHQLGITHRDIKPDNILIVSHGPKELAKVLDFGIAKVREGAFDLGGAGYTPTQTGMVVGTPQYISPEQAVGKKGDQVDGRADLYSLGVVLYEMLTGELPFRSDTPMGLLLHHIQTPPTPPDLLKPELKIPSEVSKVLMKALEKEPSRRFTSAEAMRAALDAIPPGGDASVEDLPTRVLPLTEKRGPSSPAPSKRATARPTARAPLPPVEPRKSKGLLVVAAVLTLVAAGAIGVWNRPGQKPAPTGDGRIQAEVRKAISNSSLLKHVRIQVAVEQGVVTLAGRTRSQSDADIAGSLAGSVPGVLKVTNNLQVAPLPVESVRPANDQAHMLAEVRRVLATSDSVKREAIEVSVENGVVTLFGRAARRSDADMALSLARSVEGVSQVRDLIQVESRPNPVAPPTTAPPPSPSPSIGPPLRVQQLIARGHLEMDHRNFQQAIDAFGSALQIDPQNPEARAGLHRAERAKKIQDSRRRP